MFEQRPLVALHADKRRLYEQDRMHATSPSSSEQLKPRLCSSPRIDSLCSRHVRYPASSLGDVLADDLHCTVYVLSKRLKSRNRMLMRPPRPDCVTSSDLAMTCVMTLRYAWTVRLKSSMILLQASREYWLGKTKGARKLPKARTLR